MFWPFWGASGQGPYGPSAATKVGPEHLGPIPVGGNLDSGAGPPRGAGEGVGLRTDIDGRHRENGCIRSSGQARKHAAKGNTPPRKSWRGWGLDNAPSSTGQEQTGLQIFWTNELRGFPGALVQPSIQTVPNGVNCSSER